MKPNRQLINALRKTAFQLQAHPEQYEWTDTSRCNCGLLARNLLDIPASYIDGAFLQAAGNDYAWSWTGAVQKCPQSKLLWTEIISKLVSAGVELHDFQRIEYLDKLKTVEHIPDASGFSDPIEVAKWMLKEAKELEARLCPQKVKTKVLQTVTVCSKV